MRHNRVNNIFRPLLLVLAVALSAGCSDDPQANGGKPGNKRPAQRAIPVEVANPAIGTAASHYVTTATLAPNSDAQINARTSGVVRQILREEGEDVAAGEILLKLEDDDQKLRLKQAEISLATATTEYERLNTMKQRGLVSASDWETANNSYQSAKNELELARLQLSYTSIVAPFDGRVVWREIDLGAHVATGNLLFRMMSINPLLVRVHIPANRIGHIAPGQLVDLEVDSISQTLQAIVSLVSPIVDPSTGTVKVTLQLENYPAGVRPGDFVEVSMVTDQRENAFLLPSAAIIEERGEHYVYVDQANKAVRKPVKVGFVLGNQTEIRSGLETDDRVVIKGQRNLNEGNSLAIVDPETGLVDRGQPATKTAADQSKKSKNSDS